MNGVKMDLFNIGVLVAGSMMVVRKTLVLKCAYGLFKKQ